MSQNDSRNRRWVLAQRPHGEPDDDTLRLEEVAIPEPGAGEMLLRTQWLSLDPYMRGRMNDGENYAPPVGIDEVMTAQTVSEVVSSNLDGYAPGDIVLGWSGWQDYAISDGEGVQNLGKTPDHPSWTLGVLGMPGFTAWAGLTQIGEPKEGETLVVAAATGPVGATVGQIGKILGCRVVAVAGGPEKCAYAKETLGFDECLDHRADGFAEAMKAAVPDGIDIYFENVGGKVLDAVVPRLNPGARVPVCGIVSQYNATALPEGPDRMNWLMGQILRKKLTVRGFIIWHTFGHLYKEFRAEVGPWIEEGRIHYREDVVDGLENAPRGFVEMLRGDSFGKRVVRVAE